MTKHISNQVHTKPDISALLLIHSFDENEFEVVDIAFKDEEYDKLQDELMHFWDTHPRDGEPPHEIYDKLCYIDNLRDLAAEEVGDYGDVAEELHKELWERYPYEKYHCINVDLFFADSRDSYTGETDLYVDYDYQIADIQKEWEHLDLFQKGHQLYYLDCEGQISSYTIRGITEVYNSKYKECGVYYKVEPDFLPAGEMLIPDHEIDHLLNGRFFSSIELAQEEYERTFAGHEEER